MAAKIVPPVDEVVIESIMNDPLSIPILKELYWATVPFDTLIRKHPGSESTIHRLSEAKVIYDTPDGLRITEAYQGFINDLDNPDIAPECFFIELKDWQQELGLYVSEAAYILTGSLFHAPIERNMDTDVQKLLIRSGLLDEDRDLTEEGKDVAFQLSKLVARIFDTIPVDPDKLYRRWTSE